MTGPCEGGRDEAREKDAHWDVPASTNNYQGGRFLFGCLVA